MATPNNAFQNSLFGTHIPANTSSLFQYEAFWQPINWHKMEVEKNYEEITGASY